MPIRVRQATPDDVHLLAQLEARCFTYDRIGLTSFQRFVKKSSAHVWVAIQDEHIMGYCIVLTRKNSAIWRVYSLATAPEGRGQGVAYALMDAVTAAALNAHASKIRLEVKVDNRAAIGLYRKLAFEVIDLLPSYYDDGTDGYRLQRTLS